MWLLLSACVGPPLAEPTLPEAPPGPILGGGLAVGADLSAWLSDPDRARLVHVVGGVEQSIPLPAGSRPDRLVVAGDVVVAGLRGTGAVALVDVHDHALRTVPVCAEPRGVDVAPDGLVWLACADGVLVHLDPVEGYVLDTIEVESDLRDVIDDGGFLWVSRFRSAEILRVDRTTGEVVDRFVPPTVDADTEPELSADLDPFTPSTAWRMRRNPHGGVVVLHQRGADGTVDDTKEVNEAYASFGGCDGIVHTTVTTVGPDGSMSSSGPVNLDGLAIDLAVEDDGSIVLAQLGGSNLGLIHPPAVRLIDPFGPGDDCVRWSPVVEGSQLNDAHGVAVEATSSGVVVAHRAPFGVNGVPLEVGTPLDLGWDLFHRATPSGLSCAGCHPEGHEDGRTWRFLVEGPRRTQDVAHAGSSQPYHWGGELATLDDLLSEVLVRRMGGKFEEHDPASIEALAAFLDRIPATRPVAAVDEHLARQGAILFGTAGCDTCHTDPPPTESRDVGTGGPFQVPRLAGVSARVPLMHDGCAATLRDRFDPACGGTDHADSDLTGPEVDALVVYLSTL